MTRYSSFEQRATPIPTLALEEWGGENFDTFLRENGLSVAYGPFEIFSPFVA